MSIINRTPTPRPTLDDYQRVIPGGLKQAGDEWHGACPACGGKDRFWVRRGNAHGWIIACRACRADYPTLLKAAGLDSRDAPPRYWPVHRAQGTPPAPADHAQRKATATALWTAATANIESTPAARYLREHRRVWPAGVAFPASVRWLAKQDAPGWIQGGKSGMPATAAGAIAFQFIDAAGALSAVTLDALTATGERPDDPRMPDHRWRKAYGVCVGAFSMVGTQGGEPVIIVEGEISALAAVQLAKPGAQVMAAGGANFLRPLLPMLARGKRPVEVWPDGDAVGRDAAFRLAGGLRRAGVAAKIVFDYQTEARGSDAADALQAVINATGWPAHACHPLPLTER